MIHGGVIPSFFAGNQVGRALAMPGSATRGKGSESLAGAKGLFEDRHAKRKKTRRQACKKGTTAFRHRFSEGGSSDAWGLGIGSWQRIAGLHDGFFLLQGLGTKKAEE